LNRYVRWVGSVTIHAMEWFVVIVASGLAGFVDAIVGGGGLVLVPALFAAFPGAHPATLFGTNKSASVWGTTAATWQYARKVRLPWAALLPASCWMFAGAWGGAWLVTQVSPDGFRKALPLVLLGLLVYTLARKDLGRQHQPRLGARSERWAMGLTAVVIGTYDGFFGPGTGSFLVFVLVRWLGYDFLNASASAKWLNVVSNIAALSLFAWKGHVWWHYAVVMAAANVLGSVLGSRMALRHGAGFVRGAFILVVLLLTLKTGWDAYRPG
jgi:uncharacterized protein